MALRKVARTATQALGLLLAVFAVFAVLGVVAYGAAQVAVRFGWPADTGPAVLILVLFAGFGVCTWLSHRSRAT